MKYVVVENTPGYLPDDDDPPIFETLREARQHAKTLAHECQDAYREGGRRARIFGNMKDGYAIGDPTDPYDLGRVIAVLEVPDAETDR